MQIELSPEQNSFVELGIQQGRFRNPEDAMHQALDLWVNRERTRLELLAAIELGDLSPHEADTTLDSEEDIAAFFVSVEQRGLTKLASAKLTGV